MIICDILGRMRLSVSAAQPRLPLFFHHGNKTVILNGQLQQFLPMQNFYLCLLFVIYVF